MKDLILKDSWPLKILTSKVPFLVEFNLPLINLVKFFFFLKFFFKIALNGFSFFVLSIFDK